jgi:hypothetical protein
MGLIQAAIDAGLRIQDSGKTIQSGVRIGEEFSDASVKAASDVAAQHETFAAGVVALIRQGGGGFSSTDITAMEKDSALSAGLFGLMSRARQEGTLNVPVKQDWLDALQNTMTHVETGVKTLQDALKAHPEWDIASY